MAPSRSIVRAGFTLIEVLVTITIIGVIAMMAIPSYSHHIERARSNEGAQILTTFLAAQERYRMDNNNYATDPLDLDIDIPASNNFTLPPTVNNDAAKVVTVARSNGSYTMCISSLGVVSCDGTAEICSQYAAGGVGICP